MFDKTLVLNNIDIICRRGRTNAQSIFDAVYHLRMRAGRPALGGGGGGGIRLLFARPIAIRRHIDRIRAALRSYYFAPYRMAVPAGLPSTSPPLQEPIVYGGESLKLGRPTRRRPPSSDLCGGNGHTQRNPVETGRDRSSDYFVGLESKPFGLFGVFGLDRAHRTVRSSGVVC